jgi:hypothetical protein
MHSHAQTAQKSLMYIIDRHRLVSPIHTPIPAHLQHAHKVEIPKTMNALYWLRRVF